MTATIPVETVDAAINKVYKDAAKKYKFPGFRPGKAPRSMVETLIGDEYARAVATDEVVNSTFAQLVDGEGYRVLGQPDFDEELLVVEGEEFSYVVTFEVRPQLTLKDTKVSIKMPPREVTDTEINKQIDAIRERFSQLVKAKSRTIREDDHVLISFTSTVGGEEYEGNTVDKYQYHLGQGMMPAEFEKAIVGAKPGENVEAEFVIEEGEDNSEFAGKTMHFNIEIHEIQERDLPEVNDDLAVMSGFESAEEMRSEISANIESSKMNSYDNVQNQRLAAALAEKLEGDVPDELVEERAEYLKHDFAQMLAQNDMTMEQYFIMAQVTPDTFFGDLKNQALMAISEELALEALARDEQLEPTDDEFEYEMEIIAETSGVKLDAVKEQWKKAALVTTLRDELSRRKALKWLTENSEIEIDEEAF